MKSFTYKVDLKKLNVPDDQLAELDKNAQKTLFENIMNQGLQSRYSSGVSGHTSRTYARILEKLDKVTSDTLDLEETEFELLKKEIFGEEARYMPSQTRLISLYIQNLEAAKNAG